MWVGEDPAQSQSKWEHIVGEVGEQGHVPGMQLSLFSKLLDFFLIAMSCFLVLQT